MKTTEFIKLYNPCHHGRDYALTFETMSEVWQNCERPDWLFWILEKHKPLEKEQSVRLAIAFAETLTPFAAPGDERLAQAIQAAKNWLENPCEETQRAAGAACANDCANATNACANATNTASAAYAAARVARVAARTARLARLAAPVAYVKTHKDQCSVLRGQIPNPFLS